MGQIGIDIANQRFGRLEVISQCGKSSRGEIIWLCRCDCGNTTKAKGTALRRGDVKSCGGKGKSCSRLEIADHTGKQVNEWKVIKRDKRRVYKHSTQQLWLCVCKCGQFAVRTFSDIKKTKNCGCDRRLKLKRNGTKHGKCYTVEYRIFHSAKRRAAKLNLPFDLVLSDIVIPDTCPILGIPIVPAKHSITLNSATLDKIIPSRGYVRGNVWVISHKANKMKSNHTIETLELFLSKIREQLSENWSDKQ